jgi:hypothetical protein
VTMIIRSSQVAVRRDMYEQLFDPQQTHDGNHVLFQ